MVAGVPASALQGCNTVAGVPASALQGCNMVAGVPASALQGCNMVAGTPASVLQWCNMVAGTPASMLQGCSYGQYAVLPFAKAVELIRWYAFYGLRYPLHVHKSIFGLPFRFNILHLAYFNYKICWYVHSQVQLVVLKPLRLRLR
jgi:hypothetical protein